MASDTVGPPESGPKSPVTPRDAASLVLLRDGKDGPEVLMGRRPLAARFMPGVYVFPGGAVEDPDYAMRTSRALADDVLARLKRRTEETLAVALGWTAIRETWEETGVILGSAGTAEGSDDCPALRAFAAEGVAPDLQALDYLMRAVTPSYLPIRFNTRFFVADGSNLRGTLAPRDELEDAAWLSVEEALTLNIVNVTEIVLDAARRYWRERPAPDPARPIPMFTQHTPGEIVLVDE